MSPTTKSPLTIEALWHDFHRELLSFARARIRSGSEAEDILQVAFLRAFDQLESGTSPTNPRAWLYQIVRNLILDTHRQVARRRETPGLQASEELLAIEAPDPLDIDESTSAFVARELPRFIAGLRSPYREALQQTEIEGLTQAEAAAQAGLSLSGMKSRVQRARKQLLASLHQCCAFSLDARNRVISCAPHETNAGCSSEACEHGRKG